MHVFAQKLNMTYSFLIPYHNNKCQFYPMCEHGYTRLWVKVYGPAQIVFSSKSKSMYSLNVKVHRSDSHNRIYT